MELDEEDLRHLARFEAKPKAVGRDVELLREGDPYDRTGILLEGWCLRYKMLPDGRRQVVNFVLPGSFLGFYANVFETLNHSVLTLGDCRVAWFNPQYMTDIFAERPKLALSIVWDNAREESVLMERLASLGRRSAYERVAHLIVEVCKQVGWSGGLAKGDERLPFSQAVLADALGLSTVHISRNVSRMRREGLIGKTSRGGLVVLDLTGLMGICDYDETYLYQNFRPKIPRS